MQDKVKASPCHDAGNKSAEMAVEGFDGLPETGFSRRVDHVLLSTGRFFSWVWVVLMAVIIMNVVMRYLFGKGMIEFEEMQWHLYAVGWLVGISYVFTVDGHVRIDLISSQLSSKTRAWIELFGILFFLTPFVLLVIYYAIPFILYSWELGEVSDSPGGLPYRWAIKSMLLTGFVLLALGILSRFTRLCKLLFYRTPSTQVVLSRA